MLVERDYYTITDESGEASFVLEEAFSQLEAIAADALRALLDRGLDLSEEQRAG